MLKKIIIPIIIIILISLSGCAEPDNKLPKIQNGVLDIRDNRLFENKLLALKGNWAFYWDKFLLGNDFDTTEPDLYIKIPDSWNLYYINNKRLPSAGYATYKLHIISDLPENTVLGLQIPNFSSAYRLFVNQEEISRNGVISKNEAGEIGRYSPKIVFFTVPDKEFDIVVQISNHECAYAGLWNCIIIGSAHNIQHNSSVIAVKVFFVYGIVALINLYLLILYSINRKLKQYLYFVLMCLFTVFTVDSMDQLVLYQLIQNISFKLLFYVWFSASDWCVFFLLLFCHKMYPSKISNILKRVFLIIFILFQIFFTFTKPLIYSSLVDVRNIFGGLGIIAATVIVIAAIRKGHKDGWVYIISISLLLMAYIHDILLGCNIIYNPFGKISYISILLCIMLTIIMLWKQNKEYNNRIETSELAFLQAQIKPHFIFNTINALISFTYEDIDRARMLMREFAIYLRESFDFKETNQFVPFVKELEYVKAFVDIERARFEDQLEIDFEIDENIYAEVPILILQPVVENAIIHGILPKMTGGHILVSVKKKTNRLEFCVKDDGVGFDTNQWTNRKDNGSHVGLCNIDKRLLRYARKGLTIKSEPGIGTEVSWCIPIRR